MSTLTGWHDEARCSCGSTGNILHSTFYKASYQCRCCNHVFHLHRDNEEQEITTDVTKIRDGVRIYVADDETDTLAVIEITKRYDKVLLKSGLRGNYSARHRPVQWITSSIAAPKLTRQQQEKAKSAYMRLRGI